MSARLAPGPWRPVAPRRARFFGGIFFVVVGSWCPAAEGLPLLPKGLFCANSTVQAQLPTAAASLASELQCDRERFSFSVGCCDVDDVQAVLEKLGGSIQFGMRNLEDREHFHSQLSQKSLGDHPCSPAAEAMVAKRMDLLAEAHVISTQMLRLIEISTLQLLCAACFGGPPSSLEGVAEDATRATTAVEEGLASEWRRLSQEVTVLFAGLREHDAALAEGLRQAGLSDCVTEFAESLRRGVAAPSSHAVPLRPWRSRGEGGSVQSFRDIWERWLDALVALEVEFAEDLQTEVQGVWLAFQHMRSPGSGAFALLAHAPEDEMRPEIPERVARLSSPSACLSLLVAMPNPGTNLRFDFASDPAMLSDASVEEHAAAVLPLLRIPGARVVVVTASPAQGARLRAAFGGFEAVEVVWRRFALWQADELAALLAPGALLCPSRASAVFEVAAGGDSARLSAAVEALSAGALPSLWPQPLRAARPSAWRPHALAEQGAAGLATRAALAGDGRCPIVAGVLREYLELHRGVRARLRSRPGATERILIYRCSALGFCGGHGDRLNGILGALMLAIASRRAFFIDAPRPVHLHLLLGPRRLPRACGLGGEFLLDWRMHSSVGAIGRKANYNDRYNDIVADLPWLLVEEAEPVVVLHSNQRTTIETLRSPEARAMLGPRMVDDLMSLPFLHAELLEMLFEPSALVAKRHEALASAARGNRKRLIAIHFRAGDRSPERWRDPPRHPLSELDRFLDCALLVEQRLSWSDADVAWYLAADTGVVADSARVAELHRHGKIALPPAGREDVSIIHLDRSPMSMVVEGLVDTWAQWLTIATAEATVLSTSNFGVTAAEAGRQLGTFLGSHGCLRADVTAA